MVQKIRQLLQYLRLKFSKKARLQQLAEIAQATAPKTIKLFKVRTLAGETYIVPSDCLLMWRNFVEVPATYNGAVLNSMLKETTIFPISQIAYMQYNGYMEI